MKIRIGIVGYGNLGRGVEAAIRLNEDMELVGIFSRRDLSTIKPYTDVPLYPMSKAKDMRSNIDVMILCGGSANDLPEQTPELVKYFNVVDSYDTHAKIPMHFEAVDRAAKESKKVGVISVGWDPGLFSLNRLLGQSILPGGNDYTFWGKGVSQGHSDAIRRIEGVVDARQYTIPLEVALDKVRDGENPSLSTREKHLRECYVVAKEGADKSLIEETIKTMPDYFADYDTIVHFISQEELIRDHSRIPHGGVVFRCGTTGLDQKNKHVMEFKLQLDSNPEFTSSVLLAYARAAYRLNLEGISGCKTVLDIPPAYLHPAPVEELRKQIL